MMSILSLEPGPTKVYRVLGDVSNIRVENQKSIQCSWGIRNDMKPDNEELRITSEPSNELHPSQVSPPSF